MVNEENGPNVTEDTFVNITESFRNRDFKFEAKEEDDPYATENSSSFADTVSENQSSSLLSDKEVESQFLGGSDFPPSLDGLGGTFPIRKKRPSPQWRNLIKPLMWRCKWTELRIKELEGHSSRYVKEIDAQNRKKRVAFDLAKTELSGSKSLICTGPSCKKNPMTRMKRKRIEDTTDISSYTSNHTLFSLYQNKRSGHDVAPRWEDLGKPDPHATGNDDPEFMQEKDDSLEQVLRKIVKTHAHVHKMKAQLDSLMIRNFDKFSSSENLSQLVPLQTSSVEETASLGGIYHSPPHDISDYGFGDFMMHDSAVSSFGEAIDIPDIIESTVGSLSSVDVPRDRAQVGDSYEKIVDNMLIENENDNIQQSNLYSSSLASELRFPKNKRKRGERKAGSSNWILQKPTDEP